MATIRPLLPCLHLYSNLRNCLSASCVLLAISPRYATAQFLDPPPDSIPSMAVLTLAADPTDGAQVQDFPPDAVPSMAVLTFAADPTAGDTLSSTSSASDLASPSSTDDAGYASSSTHAPQNTGILNYYFLLLAVLVIVLALVWVSLARRRRKRGVHLRDNQQSILARDVETWPGRRGVGRWRFGGAEAREEEGLNERGEAPPPYIKQPDPVHHTDGPALELHDLSRAEAKPPDYDEGATRR